MVWLPHIRAMKPFDPVQLATPVFIALVIAEMVWARLNGRLRYEPRDTAASLLMGFGSVVAGALFAFLFVGLAGLLDPYRLADIGWSWSAVALCFVLDDLRYYWFHRASHRIRWLWAAHVTHHSSQHYNLSTALQAVLDRRADARAAVQGAASPGRVFPADDPLRQRDQSGLPVLDPYRGGRPPARAARMAVQHALASPRASRHQSGLSQFQLCRRLHPVGPDVRQLRGRGSGRSAALWHRQEPPHLQSAPDRVP